MVLDQAPSLLCPDKIFQKVAALALQIQQGKDLEIILQRAITDIRTILQCDRVIIYRFLSDTDAVVLYESVGHEWIPVLGQLIYDPCFNASWIDRYRRGQISTITDVADSSLDDCYRQLLTRLQVQANLVVPVEIAGNLWGLLIIHQCRSPRFWAAMEVQLVQQIALQISSAIYVADLKLRQQWLEAKLDNSVTQSQTALTRSQLLSQMPSPISSPPSPPSPPPSSPVPAEESIARDRHIATLKEELTQAQQLLHQHAKRDHLLIAIAQRIRETLNLKAVLSTTVQEVRQFLDTDRVLIYRFEPDWSGVVIAEAIADGWISILDRQITDTYFVENQGQCYQANLSKAIDDIHTANLDPCHVNFLVDMQVRAKLAVRICQNGHLWGLLVAHHCRSPRHWSSLEVDLLQQLSTQIAIALQQSELYEQVQRLNRELEIQVQERTAQLHQSLNYEALLRRITNHVRGSLDKQEILQNVVQELAIAMVADCCHVTIYSPDHTTITLEYEYTHGQFITPNWSCAIQQSTAPQVYDNLLNGQFALFCLHNPQLLGPDQPRQSILACPIIDDQTVLGDLWLFRPGEMTFTDAEIRLVEQVTDQCAIALRQARLYQSAQAQVQELERLHQLKDDFLSTISHELRTPISTIKMVTEMLTMSLETLGVLADETNLIRQYLQVLQDESGQEINLINDLLDLTQLNAQAEPLQLTTIALQIYMPHLAEPWMARAQANQQQLHIQIPEDLPLITTELVYLERILTELLENACKYTPAGEQIRVTVQPQRDRLDIDITNTGVEIPLAERDRIFEKFYRIPNHDPWKYAGTGLGLALVKKRVEQLHGTVTVDSGNGATTFRVSLPYGLHES